MCKYVFVNRGNASCLGHAEMVEFLLKNGACIEHKTDEMHTPLMEAAMDGHMEVAKLLIEAGAKVWLVMLGIISKDH